ncbi:GTPase ObgE, partial [Rhizobium sp. KAs_5_22]
FETYTLEDEKPFELERSEDGVYVLSGAKIEKLYLMTNLDHDESVQRFSRQMRSMGVDDALREAGAQDGDAVRIKDFV